MTITEFLSWPLPVPSTVFQSVSQTPNHKTQQVSHLSSKLFILLWQITNYTAFTNPDPSSQHNIIPNILISIIFPILDDTSLCACSFCRSRYITCSLDARDHVYIPITIHINNGYDHHEPTIYKLGGPDCFLGNLMHLLSLYKFLISQASQNTLNSPEY